MYAQYICIDTIITLAYFANFKPIWHVSLDMKCFIIFVEVNCSCSHVCIDKEIYGLLCDDFTAFIFSIYAKRSQRFNHMNIMVGEKI